MQRQENTLYLRPGQSLTKWDKQTLIEWLDGALLLITNDYELEVIMKITGLDKKGLLALAGTIITTLGEKGSVILSGDSEVPVPAAKAGKVVDPYRSRRMHTGRFAKGYRFRKGLADCCKDRGCCSRICDREIRNSGAPLYIR